MRHISAPRDVGFLDSCLPFLVFKRSFEMRRLLLSPMSWFTSATATGSDSLGPEDISFTPVEIIVQHNTMVSDVVLEVIELKEPGPTVKVTRRGPRTYSICPHCEASWSLKDRLFDPRTGRPCVLDALVCPACLKSVSVPNDLDLRKIQ